MRASIPLWRQIAAWTIRGIGIALGAVLAVTYSFLIWDAPPDIDWPHARLRSVVGLYLVAPVLLFAAPVWLCGWIATFIAPLRDNDKKDSETRTYLKIADGRRSSISVR